jgi:hypothetical protein
MRILRIDLQDEAQAAQVIEEFQQLMALNEPTQITYMLPFLFPLARVPNLWQRKRVLRSLFVSENPGTFDKFDRPDDSHQIQRYHYVRHADGTALTAQDNESASAPDRPFESALRYRSDHTMMA